VSALRALFFSLLAAFLLAPLLVTAGVSLNERRLLVFPPEGVSLQWFGELAFDAAWRDATITSLTIACGAGLLAVSIALPLAWFLWRWNLAYARALFALGLAPFVLPPVITALGFLIFWSEVGLYGRMAATVISHGIFLVTLPLVTISLGFETVGADKVEAARTLGADDRTVFRTVVLPLIAPYILSGFAFAFVLSLNEYIIAYMVAGFTVETLPIKIFNSLRYGYTPTMAAVAVAFAALAVLVFGLIARFGDLLRLLGATRPPPR
jgi:putative spermidine/putrescine transport system permease protein